MTIDRLGFWEIHSPGQYIVDFPRDASIPVMLDVIQRMEQAFPDCKFSPMLYGAKIVEVEYKESKDDSERTEPQHDEPIPVEGNPE